MLSEKSKRWNDNDESSDVQFRCAREARKEVDYINNTLINWLTRKYNTVRKSKVKVWRMLARLEKANPETFYHWRMGIRPMIG